MHVRRSVLPASAVGLFLLWSIATYLLEGRVHTLARPDAFQARAAYALIANLLVGIAGSALILHWYVASGAHTPRELGFRSVRHTLWSLALAAILGTGVYLWGPTGSASSILLVNAFAQVWVVSVAEVLVCWTVLGKAIEHALAGHAPRLAARTMAWLGASLAFGAYHFAHSPPFNAAEMVVFLTLIGLATGAFYFGTDELYGTIVFHNFLALKGVTAALAAGPSSALETGIQPSIALTAGATVGALLLVDRHVRRAAPGQRPL